MKKLLVAAFSAVVFLGTSTTTFANETVNYEDQTADTRKDIKLEELPDAVKQALAADKDFTPQSAAVTRADGKVTYEVKGMKGEQAVTLYFSEDGSPVAR
jgi:hypothetical protein